MKILIITEGSYDGLNHKQAIECMNIIGSNHEVTICRIPNQIHEKTLEGVDKIIMIVPEWNGSFPYTFKQMIDNSGWPSFFKDQEILLVGTSNTQFGNLMGITHLQHILSWCSAKPYHVRVCIPEIDKKFANNNIIVTPRLNETIAEFCS